MTIENKVPGKDVLASDLTDKFPLVAKKSPDHVSSFTIADVEFGGLLVPIFAGPNMVESEDLINEIALNVKKSGAHFLRAEHSNHYLFLIEVKNIMKHDVRLEWKINLVKKQLFLLLLK